MKKAIFLGVVVFAGTIGLATDAHGQPSRVMTTINNETDRCAWITFYTSRPGAPWIAWENGFWIKPGAYVIKRPGFVQPPVVPYPVEIKVRAEFMSNAACDHPVYIDTSAELKGIWDKLASATFGLEQRKTKYWVRASN